MSTTIGWRIQVSPQYAYSDLSSSFFLNVEIPDEAAAIAFVRERSGAVPGERVYAVRPLAAAEVARPLVTGL